jgi:hypothetical protein
MVRLLRAGRRLALPLVVLSLAAPYSARGAAPAKHRPAVKRSAATRPAAVLKLTEETARYGVYMVNSRVGSMVTHTIPDAKYQEKPAVRLDADTEIKLTALGSPVEMKTAMSHFLDKKGAPLFLTMTITSSGRTTKIDAEYRPDSVHCTTDDGQGHRSTKTVPIPKGVTLVGDPDVAGNPAAQMKPGVKTTLHIFEPMSMTIQKMTSEVVKTGTRMVKGKPVKAFLLKSTGSMGESQTWVDAKGGMLESNMALAGIRMVREDVDADPNAVSYTPPQDFAVATSVRTNVQLPDPRKTTSLKLVISGIPDEALLLSDTRQQVLDRKTSGSAVTATYLIRTRELPTTAASTIQGGDVPELGDAPYLGVNGPEIQKAAKEIAGGETNRGVLARRVRAWVKGHMTKINNVGAPRSAAEIMKSRDGVCRDYATLFAAVARAAGVPTRLCAGLLYFQGSFYYHAWNECKLTDSEDGWYAFDSTLSDDFVDATHIKLAQGEPTETYAATRAVGQIKAEILEYK